jgi:DNA-binding NarL/FixJ family response regulator
LLDDHTLFRQGVSRLLGSEADFELVAECGTPAEALEVLRKMPVDIVLLDFDLGEDRGTRFITDAQKAGFTGRFLMLTAGMSGTESAIAFQLGASGIFLKHNSPALLAEAIRAVELGRMWVDPKIVQSMANTVAPPSAAAMRKALTAREQEVLQGIFEGLSNKEIAAHLGVTDNAVKATLQQLFEKTGVRTRSQLVRIALEASLAGPRT